MESSSRHTLGDKGISKFFIQVTVFHDTNIFQVGLCGKGRNKRHCISIYTYGPLCKIVDDCFLTTGF